MVSAFYVGLAGLQTGEDTRAKEKLTLATQLAPGEPAAWADLALFTARPGRIWKKLRDTRETLWRAHWLRITAAVRISCWERFLSKRGKLVRCHRSFPKGGDAGRREREGPGVTG